jgi:hypothetical protein
VNEAEYDPSDGKTNDQPSMLASYIYAEASISERLFHGVKPPSEEVRVVRLKGKVDKLQEKIEGLNGSTERIVKWLGSEYPWMEGD